MPICVIRAACPQVDCGAFHTVSTIKAEIGLRLLLQKGRVMVTCRVGFKAGKLSAPHFALVIGIDEDGTVHVQDSWGYGGLKTGIDADGGMFTLTWDKFDACWQSVPTEEESLAGVDQMGEPIAGVDGQCRSWAQITSREV